MSARKTRALLAMIAAGAPAEQSAQTIFSAPLTQAPLYPPIVRALLTGSAAQKHPELAQRMIEALPPTPRSGTGAPLGVVVIAIVAASIHTFLQAFVWPVLHKMQADFALGQAGFNGLSIVGPLIWLGLLLGLLSVLINGPIRGRKGIFGFLGLALQRLQPPRALRSVEQTLRWLAAIETAQLRPAKLLESIGGRTPLSRRSLRDLLTQMRTQNSAWAAVQAWAKDRSEMLQNMTASLAPQESRADAIQRVAKLYPRTLRFGGALEMLGMASLCTGIGAMVIPVYLAVISLGMAF